MLLLPRCVLLHLLLHHPLPLLLLFLLFLLLHLFLLSEVDEHKMYYQLTALFMRRAAVFPFMARAADLNNDQPSDTHTHTCTPSHTHMHSFTHTHTRRHLHVVGGRSCSCCAVFRFLLVVAACSFSVSALYSLQVYSLQSSTVSTVFSCLSLSNSKS